MCCICRVLFPCCFSNKAVEPPLLHDGQTSKDPLLPSNQVDGNIQHQHIDEAQDGKERPKRPKTPERLIGEAGMYKGGGNTILDKV